MNFEAHTGLSVLDIQLIQQAAQKQAEITRVILFGSRAKSTHRPGSDVDLAVQGDEVTYETVIQLAIELNEELPLPYMFDVLNYNSLAEPALKEHIDRVGLQIYPRVIAG